jgi:diacylglycerol kinase (ATP)
MPTHQSPDFLFIINPGSGAKDVDWTSEIDRFFASSAYRIEKYVLEKNCCIETIKDKIKSAAAGRVVAVGGDGTVKLVAECILNSDIAMGILPAGSANGLAKELGIPVNPLPALQLLLVNDTRFIHVIRVNGQLCIHLSDAGFNASVVKLFESGHIRGMAGYVRAAWKVLWRHSVMRVQMTIDGREITRDAPMIVIANATRYGSGAVINPAGRLDDDVFEVVVVRKISFAEIFKMVFTHAAYNPEKTALYQGKELLVTTQKSVHFQIDGEYQGKIDRIEARLLPGALKILNYPEAVK